MSGTMASQGSGVQLEQSDRRLALNMAKLPKDGLLRGGVEETKYLIKKPRAEVREEMKRAVEFPGYKKVKAAIQRQPAMLRHNQTSGYLPYQNGITKNPQTCLRRKQTGVPTPTRRRVRTPELTQTPSGAPPTPTSNTSGAQLSGIVNLPAGYTYSYTALPGAEFFKDDEDTKLDTNFDTDMLTEDGLYTICCVVMWLTFTLKSKAAD
jgi:hypothetical protein